jgi:hypothetical protein
MPWITVKRRSVPARASTAQNNPDRDLRQFLKDMTNLQRGRAREQLSQDRNFSEQPAGLGDESRDD